MENPSVSYGAPSAICYLPPDTGKHTRRYRFTYLERWKP